MGIVGGIFLLKQDACISTTVAVLAGVKCRNQVRRTARCRAMPVI